MERHDADTIPEGNKELKVPFLHSDRLILWLFCLLLVLHGITFSTLLLKSISWYIQETQTVRDLRSQYQEGYVSLTSAQRLLDTYLNDSREGNASRLEMAAGDLQALITLLDESPVGRYEKDMGILCGRYLTSLRKATDAQQEGDREEILRTFTECSSIYDVIITFSPYASGEMEDYVAAETGRLRDTLTEKIRLIMLGLAVATAGIFLLVYIFARFYLRPIEKLASIAHAVSAPDRWTVSEPSLQRRDEMGLLYRTFYEMMNQIRRQFDELLEKQRLKQLLQEEREKGLRSEALLMSTKLKVFQSQINSHFLFNTLNMIAHLAFLEDAPKTHGAAGLLAQFLRSVLDQFSRNVTLQEEFETIGRYVEIQTLRFGNRVTYEEFLDPELLNFLVPAMTMQPMIENAIIHGIATAAQGFIRYSAQLQDDGILLSVWDDGMGMSEEAQEALRQKMEMPESEEILQEEEKRRGIGLVNVYRRLNLLYPGKVSFLLESEEGSYTHTGFLLRDLPEAVLPLPAEDDCRPDF